MPLPTFQELMLPLLKAISDRNDYRLKVIKDELANIYNLNSEERNILLPSGRGKLFNNRVDWAKFYLLKAGLISSPRRGYIKITSNGLNASNQNPQIIDRAFLSQFEEFREFQEQTGESRNDIQGIEERELPSITPEEAFEEAYKKIRQELAQNLLDLVKSNSPEFFEKLVIDLLIGMGYGGSREDAGRRLGRSHDGGIDGVIKEDILGLDVIYIQAKRWENTVGRPIVQGFVGALSGQHANKGIFITTSKFSKEAEEYVKNLEQKVALIDGIKLTEYMIDNNIGVSPLEKYEIKDIDSDYFDEE